MQQVRLEGYRAFVPGAGYLRLGNWDSYGIETLQILPGEDWQGLELTATFVTPAGATRVRVPETGLLPVPPEATAAPLGTRTPGRLVFAGMAREVQRLSTDVFFLVSDHAATEKQQNVTPDSGYYGLSDVTVASCLYVQDTFSSDVLAELGKSLAILNRARKSLNPNQASQTVI